jgi:hypothetical protein
MSNVKLNSFYILNLSIRNVEIEIENINNSFNRSAYIYKKI